MLTPDQALSVPKTQFAAFTTLGQHWLDCSERLAARQLRTGRAALTDCAALAQDLLAAQSPQQLLSVCQGAVAPMTEKAEAYCRSLYEIVAGAGASWSRLTGLQASEMQQQFGTVVEGALQHLPQESDSVATWFRQALASASTAMESVQKAALQAAEVADSNLQAITQPHAGKSPVSGG